ncbi:MAG TPA: DUF4397 domain-containing protein [Abditibacterium sp.]|jgi:hypothetical protein
MNRKLLVLSSTLISSIPLLAQPALDKPAIDTTQPQKPPVKADKKVVGGPRIAFLRVLHAIPNGPAVDVYAGATKVASNLKFKSFSDYIEIKSGKNTFKVVGAGKTEPVIVTDTATATRGRYFTLAIHGKQTASLLLVGDSLGKANPAKARVRFVHLSPGAPAIAVTTPSTRNKAGFARFVTKPLGHGKTASKLAKPATLKLQIRDSDGKIIKETPDVNLEAGKRYGVYAVGEIGNTGVGAFDVLIQPAAR